MSAAARVLHVIARLNVGGPATQVLALADGLDPSRFAVTIASGSAGPGEGEFVDLRAPTAEVETLTSLGPELRPLADARALAELDRLVRRLGPDLVHTHTAKAGLLGRLVAARHGLPTVHTFHGHLLEGYFGPRITRAVVAVERRLAASTARLCTVGQRVRDDLLAAGVGTPGQYVALRPGVVPPALVDRREARQRLGLNDDAAVVAAVGRLTAIKRPDRLLDAAVRLAAQGRRVTVLLAGDGELRGALEARAARQRLDVRFLGWRSDVGTVYRAADLVALTSDNEGMPVALIEAAMCGCPAVATNVGSVAEVVEHGQGGLVVDADAVGVARGIAALLDDPARREAMGQAATERARRRFSVDALVGETAALYDAVLAEHARA